jgi:hypothetical protein
MNDFVDQSSFSVVNVSNDRNVSNFLHVLFFQAAKVRIYCQEAKKKSKIGNSQQQSQRNGFRLKPKSGKIIKASKSIVCHISYRKNIGSYFYELAYLCNPIFVLK